jgi:hypothetical protein
VDVVRKDTSEPLPGPFLTDSEGWNRCERLNKSEAEELLDWLEANGYTQRELTYADGVGFSVRWKP